MFACMYTCMSFQDPIRMSKDLSGFTQPEEMWRRTREASVLCQPWLFFHPGQDSVKSEYKFISLSFLKIKSHCVA